MSYSDDAYKVLLVAADSPLRKLVLEQIKGFHLSCVSSGEEAIEQLLVDTYHLLVIHETLPSMNGLTLLNYVRNTLRSPIPTVLVFDSEDPDLIRFAREAGVCDYILKREIEHTTILPRMLDQVLARRHLESKLNDMRKRMKEFALVDPLTRAYNRTYFEQSIALEVARARANKEHLTIVMVDVDNFKSVNDHFGHLTGDVVLREIAAIIRNHLHRRDILCRYGGDEFLILFPATPPEEALTICSQFQLDIEHHLFKSNTAEVHATVSIGLIPFANHHMNEEDFLHNVDHHLYLAKRQGKNCISYN